ncbi:hypothetical protein SAMN02910264_00996 [Ruminococcaceae bacterium YAD3003]|nr:hypothetical protein SAMN02910264_00996 [Ruminococcaceae bacterium YAD3003]
MTKICTRCLLKDFNKEQYEAIVTNGLSSLPKEDLTGSDITEKRLAVCRDCDKLNQGTCLACGCFVEIRASLKKGKCPYDLWK